jgi:uncharacterized protein
MEAYYRGNPLRFECTGCGACCSGDGEQFVFLAPGEAQAIAGHLGVRRERFRRRYMMLTPAGDRVLRMTGRGTCVFLQENGSCAIYATRPLQCRTYPYWLELVTTREAWEREAARCEGIGRGAQVPLAVIEAALRSAE